MTHSHGSTSQLWQLFHLLSGVLLPKAVRRGVNLTWGLHCWRSGPLRKSRESGQGVGGGGGCPAQKRADEITFEQALVRPSLRMKQMRRFRNTRRSG